MCFEEKIITKIRKIMPRGPLQMNEVFCSDSEILQFNQEKLLVNIDTFSKEDHFNESDFYCLGWNLAVAGISDILACGGKPVFYGHSLIINKKWTENEIQNLTYGIKDVLNQTQTQFIGGDFGIHSDWSYTAVVIGKPGQKILSRENARPGDMLYLSGRVGAGNLDAAINLFNKDQRGKMIKNKFPIRLQESQLITRYSSCCIDTSDGLLNALNSISTQSKAGYEVKNIPVSKIGLTIAKIFSLPYELLLFAECGEYELLFTIPEELELDFFKEAKLRGLNFHKIGSIQEASTRILKNKNRIINLDNINARARDYENSLDYIHDLIKQIKEQKK